MSIKGIHTLSPTLAEATLEAIAETLSAETKSDRISAKVTCKFSDGNIEACILGLDRDTGRGLAGIRFFISPTGRFTSGLFTEEERNAIRRRGIDIFIAENE